MGRSISPQRRYYGLYHSVEGWLLSARSIPVCSSCLYRISRQVDMFIPCPRCEGVHHASCGRFVDNVCALCAEEECSGP